MKKNRLVIALAGALLLPAVGPAFAQSATTSDQAPAKSSTKQLQTVVVTGSAIPRIDAETSSPVTVITAKQIARSGYTTISDVVRSISADNSGSVPNAFGAGFAAGASGVALRGLTVNSTLVLIDGHRVTDYPVSDDGERSFVDLNTIPIAAVERVEVLKDGASSLYGADAIAGVVNIILKPDFHGVEATADVGTSAHGGGFTKKGTFLAGGGDLEKDHYNAYFSAQYEEDDAIQVGSRGFPYNTADLTRIGGQNNLGGNPALNSGSVYGSVAPGVLTTPAGGFISGVTQVPGSLYQPLSACGSNSQLTTSSVGSYCQQNFSSQYGQIQPKMKQDGLYGRVTVKINDTTKAYLSAGYDESKTTVIGAPEQIQTSTPVNTNSIALPPVLANGQLNPNDPFAAAGQYALLNYAFGNIPQFTQLDNHNLRAVGDIAGVVGEWNYDATVVLNHDWLNTNQQGFINYNALVSAIDNGTYNFVNPSQTSAATLAALAPGNQKVSTSDLDSLDLSANRELWDLPGGPLGLGVGAQLRHEAQNDPSLNPGEEFQGLGVAQTKGSRDVSGVYAELDAPLLNSLEADLSGRFDHYSDFGNNFSPKLGLKWKPADWIAIRGTYSKGFRAPSFAENGSSQSEGFVSGFGGASELPASFIAAHKGSPYATQPYTLAEFTAANPNIKPEKSTNFTFGVILQPASWFSASVDYYNIKKTNVIVAADTASALTNYFAGTPQAAGVSVIPDAPDPAAPNAQARPAEIIGEYINANSLKTSGVDVDLQGHWSFDNGIKYVTEATGTEIFNWTEEFPDGEVESFAGTHGPYNLSSGAGTPRYRESWSNTLEYGPLTVTGTFYHTSGMANYAEDVDVGPGECLSVIPEGPNCRVGSFTDFDLTGSYDVSQKFSITASIMNAFDRKAPLDLANYAALNYNPTYAQDGAVGRFFNLGVKFKM